DLRSSTIQVMKGTSRSSSNTGFGTQLTTRRSIRPPTHTSVLHVVPLGQWNERF
ncbi:hypothetical protein CRM22_002845, partial [Opisthorchis felineus]